MKETEFATRFAAWFLKNRNLFPDKILFEYKVTDGNTFNLKEWTKKQPHQLRSLTHAQNDVGVYHKISDQSSGQKPADAFFIANGDSYLCVYFNKQKKFFVLPYPFLVTKISQTSVSFDQLSQDLDAYTLLQKTKAKIIEF